MLEKDEEASSSGTDNTEKMDRLKREMVIKRYALRSSYDKKNNMEDPEEVASPFFIPKEKDEDEDAKWQRIEEIHKKKEEENKIKSTGFKPLKRTNTWLKK